MIRLIDSDDYDTVLAAVREAFWNLYKLEGNEVNEDMVRKKIISMIDSPCHRDYD